MRSSFSQAGRPFSSGPLCDFLGMVGLSVGDVPCRWPLPWCPFLSSPPPAPLLLIPLFSLSSTLLQSSSHSRPPLGCLISLTGLQHGISACISSRELWPSETQQPSDFTLAHSAQCGHLQFEPCQSRGTHTMHGELDKAGATLEWGGGKGATAACHAQCHSTSHSAQRHSLVLWEFCLMLPWGLGWDMYFSYFSCIVIDCFF